MLLLQGAQGQQRKEGGQPYEKETAYSGGIGRCLGRRGPGRTSIGGVAALTAAPSTQTFYVDGKQVDLKAYVIHGHNYVQLRDVGRAVDFGVAYDQGANRVLVDTSSPYTE